MKGPGGNFGNDPIGGTEPLFRPAARSVGGDMNEEKCPKCGGEGHDGATDPNGEPNPNFCPACKGSGRAPLRSVGGDMNECPNPDCVDGWWWCDIGDDEMIRQRCGHPSHREPVGPWEAT
jgi:hypothetical protein